MKFDFKTLALALCLIVAAAALGTILHGAQASVDTPGYDIIMPGAAPEYGRAAPYGQFAITHLSKVITTTEDLGTIARTAGYDPYKVVMCSVGDYPITVNLYARISSTGDTYTLSVPFAEMEANSLNVVTFTESAPWMNLGLVSEEITGSTTMCGIWMQTP